MAADSEDIFARYDRIQFNNSLCFYISIGHHIPFFYPTNNVTEKISIATLLSKIKLQTFELSLGGSLMRDILGTNSATTTDDILSSLEAELDASMPPPSSSISSRQALSNTSDPVSLAMPPPGIPVPNSFSRPLSSTTSSSAAALIVSHQKQQQRPNVTTQISSLKSGADRWGNSMFSFDKNAAVADFLREDAARKKEKEKDEEIMRKEMDKILSDYDIDEEPKILPSLSSLDVNSDTLASSTHTPNKMISSVPPGLTKPSNATNTHQSSPPISNVQKSNALTWDTQKEKNSINLTTNTMSLSTTQINSNLKQNPNSILPPFLQSKVSPASAFAVNMAPPPINQQETSAATLPQSATNISNRVHAPNGGFISPQPGHAPTQIQAPGLGQVPPPPNLPHPHAFFAQGPPQPLPAVSKAQLPHFMQTSMIPAMVPPPPRTMPLMQVPKNQLGIKLAIQQSNRIFFFNPNPKASPLPATKVSSSLMTGRDLSYVIHSMLRPLNVINTDPEEDFYFRKFHEQENQRLAMMGIPTSSTVAAKTSLDDSEEVTESESKRMEKEEGGDESKQSEKNHRGINEMSGKKKDIVLKGKEAEAQFRAKAESRAKEWKGEMQVLGHVVKSNIHRPRAILDVLLPLKENGYNRDNMNINPDSKDLDSKDSSVTAEDNAKSRAMLWKARKLIDTGHIYWLDKKFQKLSTLILKEKGTMSELSKENKGKKNAKDFPLYINLGLLLNMTKGRDLLARCLEYKRFPIGHQNNYTFVDNTNDFGLKEDMVLSPQQVLEILPDLLSNLFINPAGAKTGEDRLLYICISYVIGIVGNFNDTKNDAIVKDLTRQFILCVEVVMLASESSNYNLKENLGSRARAEVMHAILSKGGEICMNNGLASEWKVVEEKFMKLLISSN